VSGLAWVLGAMLLAVAAAVAAWPARRAVLRRLNGPRRSSLRAVDLRGLWSRFQALADGSPRRAVGIAVLSGAAVGTILAGPIAGLVLAVYGALGARAAVRRAARRRAVAARSRSLDDLNALAADLRAGLAIGPLAIGPLGGMPGSTGSAAGGQGSIGSAVGPLAGRPGSTGSAFAAHGAATRGVGLRDATDAGTARPWPSNQPAYGLNHAGDVTRAGGVDPGVTRAVGVRGGDPGVTRAVGVPGVDPGFVHAVDLTSTRGVDPGFIRAIDVTSAGGVGLGVTRAVDGNRGRGVSHADGINHPDHAVHADGVKHADDPDHPDDAGHDQAFDPRLAELTAAVWRLAEQTGAPAADLVERIEADARASDRSRATAAAQAAGAQATALLLAALPIGGIALGYGIGVDPLQVLLHTPLGAACAIGATLLQCGGLLWADRLSNGPAR
jgi:hypothetical protein